MEVGTKKDGRIDWQDVTNKNKYYGLSSGTGADFISPIPIMQSMSEKMNKQIDYFTTQLIIVYVSETNIYATKRLLTCRKKGKII